MTLEQLLSKVRVNRSRLERLTRLYDEHRIIGLIRDGQSDGSVFDYGFSNTPGQFCEGCSQAQKRQMKHMTQSFQTHICSRFW